MNDDVVIHIDEKELDEYLLILEEMKKEKEEQQQEPKKPITD